MANETTTTQQTNTGNAAASGVSDLDRFLNEFKDTSTPPQAPAGLDKFVEVVKPVVEYAESKRREELVTAEKKSVQDAVDFVKNDEGLKTVSNRLVKGFLQDRYAEDQSFKTAYDNRSRDPKAWESALNNAKTEFKTELSTLNGNSVRSDVEAATAAVRGSAKVTTTEQKVDAASLMDMSDFEFNKLKRTLDAQNRRR